MEKPQTIFDRDREWDALVTAFEADRPELVFVTGRRRTGKSYLLTRFSQEVGGVYFQATRASPSDQLARLAALIGDRFDDASLRAGARVNDWHALFEILGAHIGDEPLVLVLDEFPFLADTSPELPSVIQHFWDHGWQRSRIRLVLCGSHISAMSKLQAADQPLFGRRTSQLCFAPFSYRDAARFVPDWSARDRFLAYGLFGGLPGNLTLIEASRTLEANVQDLLLHPSGRLVDDAQHIVDAFLGTAQVHYAIIEAIAGGNETWSGITNRTGRSGGSLVRPLQWLIDMQIIERSAPISERDPNRSKRALYRVRDPYLSFWHATVRPLIQRGAIGLTSAETLWETVKPTLDDHMGPVFERICLQFVAEQHEPFEPLLLGRWWDARSRHEVVLVALSPDGRLLVGECKWGPVTRDHLVALRSRALMVQREMPEANTIELALFTGRGTVDDAVERAESEGEVRVYRPSDLLEERA